MDAALDCAGRAPGDNGALGRSGIIVVLTQRRRERRGAQRRSFRREARSPSFCLVCASPRPRRLGVNSGFGRRKGTGCGTRWNASLPARSSESGVASDLPPQSKIAPAGLRCGSLRRVAAGGRRRHVARSPKGRADFPYPNGIPSIDPALRQRSYAGNGLGVRVICSKICGRTLLMRFFFGRVRTLCLPLPIRCGEGRRS